MSSLEALVEELRAERDLDDRSLDRILRKHPKDGKGFWSRSEIIAGFRRLAARRGYSREEPAFLEKVRMRPVRTLSGVTPVTVLTEPFPCPGRCIFCPNDVRMPKSYLADEPGCQRAQANGFDPYLQAWNRLAAYRAIGHAVDKVELIVLGGTFSFYPEAYRIAFVRDCLAALSDFGAGVDRRGERRPAPARPGAAPRRTGSGAAGYNAAVRAALRRRAAEGRAAVGARGPWESLEAEQRANEGAACRCVGLSVETRPDCVTPAELVRLRRLGATKVQLGVQSLSDEVLAHNRRGHDVAAARRALRLLRGAGFKLQVHWMANLLGATPASDRSDFARLFEDPDFRPDELKLYPCSLIDGTELMERWRDGSWRAYGHDELLELVTSCLLAVPAWCRVSRVVRDISSAEIVAGNRLTNFRELAEGALARRGARCRDIRAREIRRADFDPAALVLREERYATAIGSERFLELATPDDRLVAFLRLALPLRPSPLDELGAAAVVREVHVYGTSLPLGGRRDEAAQHRGLGRRLVERAAALARAAGYARLAVISSVGTRAWYRRLGFEDGALYQHLPLGSSRAQAATGRDATASAISASSASVSCQPMQASVMETP